MKDYSVYMHRCKENGKVYIGMTNNIDRRWKCNGIEYKPQDRDENNSRFWNAIKKYGWNNFEHIIIETGMSFEECAEREKYYIKLYNSQDKSREYNIADGGNGGHIYSEHPKGMLGKHHNEAKRKAQSDLMKKLISEGKCGAVWKNGHPKGMLGKHHTEEYKQRLRNIPPDKHPSARKVVIQYPDGRKQQYGCLKYLSEDIKVNESTLIKTIKSNVPYKINKRCHKNLENLSKIEGCKIYYLDNTEVNG